jgi:hypothetical protein
MDDVRSAMDRANVEINTFISSSPKNTQEFKDTVATLNKVAESAGDVNNQKRYTYVYDKLTNSSASQAAFSVLELGTVEHVLGVIESELKKKQEEAILKKKQEESEKSPEKEAPKKKLLKRSKKKRKREKNADNSKVTHQRRHKFGTEIQIRLYKIEHGCIPRKVKCCQRFDCYRCKFESGRLWAQHVTVFGCIAETHRDRQSASQSERRSGCIKYL